MDAESGRDPRGRRHGDVTASEVASYAFCAKAWHLERVARATPSAAGRMRRERGVERHRAHGARVGALQSHGRTLLRAGGVLLVLALLLALAALAALALRR